MDDIETTRSEASVSVALEPEGAIFRAPRLGLPGTLDGMSTGKRKRSSRRLRPHWPRWSSSTPSDPLRGWQGRQGWQGWCGTHGASSPVSFDATPRDAAIERGVNLLDLGAAVALVELGLELPGRR